jgi:NADH-quinone oxidoreductase subunit H
MLDALGASIVGVTLTLTGLIYMMWVERKLVTGLQVRRAPRRIGPYGLLQPLAFGLKLVFKQELLPAQVDHLVFILAPVITLTPLLLLLAALPLGGKNTLGLAGDNVAVLYALTMIVVPAYGVALAGWASNSSYALWSGLRAVAHSISYQLPLALSIVGVTLLSGSMSLGDIVERQREIAAWFIFVQPLAGLVFLLATLVEVNRAPFDLPQVGQTLDAGYYAEYNGIKFALFFVAEYIKTIVLSALMVTFFFGGWLPPFPNLLRGPWEAVGGFGWLAPLWFGGKVLVWLTVILWMRAMMPRPRYDHLMRLSWKVLLPLALLNVLLTAGLMVVWNV